MESSRQRKLAEFANMPSRFFSAVQQSINIYLWLLCFSNKLANLHAFLSRLRAIWFGYRLAMSLWCVSSVLRNFERQSEKQMSRCIHLYNGFCIEMHGCSVCKRMNCNCNHHRQCAKVDKWNSLLYIVINGKWFRSFICSYILCVSAVYTVQCAKCNVSNKMVYRLKRDEKDSACEIARWIFRTIWNTI